MRRRRRLFEAGMMHSPRTRGHSPQRRGQHATTRPSGAVPSRPTRRPIATPPTSDPANHCAGTSARAVAMATTHTPHKSDNTHFSPSPARMLLGARARGVPDLPCCPRRNTSLPLPRQPRRPHHNTLTAPTTLTTPLSAPTTSLHPCIPRHHHHSVLIALTTPSPPRYTHHPNTAPAPPILASTASPAPHHHLRHAQCILQPHHHPDCSLTCLCCLLPLLPLYLQEETHHLCFSYPHPRVSSHFYSCSHRYHLHHVLLPYFLPSFLTNTLSPPCLHLQSIVGTYVLRIAFVAQV